MCTDMGVKILSLDIISVSRLKKRGNNKQPPSVLLCLTNFSKYEEMLSNKNNLRKHYRSRNICILPDEDGKTRYVRSIYNSIEMNCKNMKSQYKVKVTDKGIKINGKSYSLTEYDKVPIETIPPWDWVKSACDNIGFNPRRSAVLTADCSNS